VGATRDDRFLAIELLTVCLRNFHSRKGMVRTADPTKDEDCFIDVMVDPTHTDISRFAQRRGPQCGPYGGVLPEVNHALQTTDRPVLLALTRQNVPTLDRSKYAAAEGALKGGYIVRDCDQTPEIVLIGTGSELQHCIAAAETLANDGVAVRVVSLP